MNVGNKGEDTEKYSQSSAQIGITKSRDSFLLEFHLFPI